MTASITLTDEFNNALSILDSGRHLFLTGKAGTGKSTLIRHFMANTTRNVVVAAPTGIAALNVDGYTIHRLFSFGTTTTLDDVRFGDYRPGRFTPTLKSIETLIIDEASMVRADLFDKVAAALERYGPKPETPFGGVQIVLVGDLLQLPPVVETELVEHFETHYETPYFFSAESFDREAFPTVALTTVFRQLGDDRLTTLLNAVREGVLLDHAKRELDSRVDANFDPPEDELWLTLAPSNNIVRARNRQRLERLTTELFESKAEESGDLSTFDAPTDRLLEFKVGAQIMMLNNDASERWVNGTLGRIVGVNLRQGEFDVKIELADGSVVDVQKHTWDVTRPTAADGIVIREIIGLYTQLPFKLAWAITIHKSQGQTLDRLVVDLTGGVFASGQVYVALSRATRLDGLVLKRPVEPRHLRTDRRIARFLYESLAATGPVRHAVVAASFVGDEGTFSRPRPVEIAIAFDDGTAISTLINPERDLADARTAYDIAADDVLLAPTLAEAWAVIGRLLEGFVPVGVDIDDVLGKIDFELKRLKQNFPMPIGIDISDTSLDKTTRSEFSSPHALDRAQAVLGVFDSSMTPLGTPFAVAEHMNGEPSYLLSRDAHVKAPTSDLMPTLSALVQVSQAISSTLLSNSVENISGHHDSVASDGASAAATAAVASRLANVASKMSRLSPELLERLGHAESLLNASFLDQILAEVEAKTVDADTAFAPGARICFTGTAITLSGREMKREEMENIAEQRGLIPVNNVTNTRCDVLVVAELGTQSGKARNANKFGKPVIAAVEFFSWAGIS